MRDPVWSPSLELAELVHLTLKELPGTLILKSANKKQQQCWNFNAVTIMAIDSIYGSSFRREQQTTTVPLQATFSEDPR